MRQCTPAMVLAILVPLAACQAGAEHAVSVAQAWSRPAAQGGTSAVYFELRGGDEDDALLGAHSPSARLAQLHRSQMNDQGHVEMHHMARVEVHSRQVVAFEPGGLHVMLIDVLVDLQPGDRLELNLRFERAGEVTIDVPVEDR
jgi:periplasmic copper chaperone A